MEESSLFRGLTPSFHVIFHVIWFFTTNGDITKNNWLKNTQGNFYDGVSFSRVISLQFSDCNFTVKIIHRRFFWKVYQAVAVLKKERKSFFEKKSI